MEKVKQVFETPDQARWKKVVWTGRFFTFLLVFLALILVVTLYLGSQPNLPNLQSKSRAFAAAINTKNPLVFKNRQNIRYTGFKNFLFKKLKSDSIRQFSRKPGAHETGTLIRAGFYVPWDNASLHDLVQNGSRLNTIFPEWLFIDTLTHRLDIRIDSVALRYMRGYNLKIFPILSNFNSSKADFDYRLLRRIFSDRHTGDQFIASVIHLLEQYGFAGINVDFEELHNNGEGYLAFEKRLAAALHKNGLLLTSDVAVNDDDYNLKELNAINDYLVVMAYDEHNTVSGPGPVSSQKWIEQSVGKLSEYIQDNKLILGVAGYGGEWVDGKYSQSISYDQALNMANQVGGDIFFDDNSYNLHFDFDETNDDGETEKHEMWFTDAATIYNILRFSDESGFAGTSLWRLGTEDKRMWRFYDRSLTNRSLAETPFPYDTLGHLPMISNVNFIGEGEVLDIIKGPHDGFVTLEPDTTEQLISEEHYTQIPGGYVIRKFAEDTTTGRGHKLILTFDDGPSAEWTPQILSILEKEHVPAAFFVVGLQAEQNIPLIKREYDDGFEIGNHTFTHHNIAEMTHRRAALEMKLTRLLIESVTGHSTILFRAPYNADSQPESFEELSPIEQSRHENYLTINEGIDPNDWKPGVSADSIVARVIRYVEQNNASIILLHDAGGETREATVEALPQIIRYFKAKGYVFTSIAGLMGTSRDALMPLVADQRDQLANKFNFLFAEGTYWTGNLIFTLFLAAIVLSILRMVIMMAMAGIQKRRDRQSLSPASFFTDKGVSVIIPAYNEEVNCVQTVRSMLSQQYPLFEIVFVDDGSKDHTFQRMAEAFPDEERVKIFTKPNGGKASALNYGIGKASYDRIVCVDADTQLKSDAIWWLMTKLEDGNTAAVAGNVKVGNEVNMLTKWQSIEYITSQNFDRRAYDLLNCITVIPGAIGAFKKDALLKVGGFATDTLAEDCDLTMRLLSDGYVVRNCAEAVSYTEAPETFRQFFKQRFRWSFGVMQCFWKHRYALFNPKYKNFGMIALPNILMFQIILSVLAPLADIVLIISVVLAASKILVFNLLHVVSYYLIFTLVDVIASAVAFAFEKENPKKLIWILPQRLVYREMMYIILLTSLKNAIKGEIQHWGSLARTGNVKNKAAATT